MADRWFWPAGGQIGVKADLAGDMFVVANGKDEMNLRTRAEISADGKSTWGEFAPTLAGCLKVWLIAREWHGTNHNRVMIELAQVPAFARFIKEDGNDIGNFVSNPIKPVPLPRPPYDPDAAEQLRQRVITTLDLPEDWRLE